MNKYNIPIKFAEVAIYKGDKLVDVDFVYRLLKKQRTLLDEGVEGLNYDSLKVFLRAAGKGNETKASFLFDEHSKEYSQVIPLIIEVIKFPDVTNYLFEEWGVSEEEDLIEIMKYVLVVHFFNYSFESAQEFFSIDTEFAEIGDDFYSDDEMYAIISSLSINKEIDSENKNEDDDKIINLF